MERLKGVLPTSGIGSERKSTARPWVKKRLTTMAELRGAQLPSSDALTAMASALSGFTDALIDAGCAALESAEIAQYEARMPTIHALEEACRATASAPKKTRWCGKCREGNLADGSRCGCACLDCNGSGWVTFEREVKGYSRPLSFAQKCHCRRKGA